MERTNSTLRFQSKTWQHIVWTRKSMQSFCQETFGVWRSSSTWNAVRLPSQTAILSGPDPPKNGLQMKRKVASNNPILSGFLPLICHSLWRKLLTWCKEEAVQNFALLRRSSAKPKAHWPFYFIALALNGAARLTRATIYPRAHSRVALQCAATCCPVANRMKPRTRWSNRAWLSRDHMACTRFVLSLTVSNTHDSPVVKRRQNESSEKKKKGDTPDFRNNVMVVHVSVGNERHSSSSWMLWKMAQVKN